MVRSRSAKVGSPPFGRHRIIITTGQEVRTSISVPPWLAAAVLVLGIAFSVAYLGATAYLVFRDEIVGAAVSHQARIQHAYEDRLASLRAQIDRINSRQLMDQEAFEAKMEQLLQRQKLLDGQQARVTQVLEKARQAGLKLAPFAPAEAAPAVETTGAPLPLPRPMPLKTSDVGSPFTPAAPAKRTSATAAAERIAQVEAALERFSVTQAAAVEAVTRLAEQDASRIEKTIGRLGIRLTTEPLAYARPDTAIGGPFVKLLDPSAVLARAAQAEAAMARMARLRASLQGLPLAEPLKGELDLRSTFGTRNDPFLGVPAMHTGLDFAAPTGEPVYATAPGVVTIASRQAGYGLTVEIDHIQGLSTRYGHLSRIAVSVGEKVKAGQLIGYVGSTGRSTGPHLHYETRINGEPVDPQRFLDAGEQLRAFRS